MQQIFFIPPESAYGNAVQACWQIDRNNSFFNKEMIIPKGSCEIIFNLSWQPGFNATIGNRHFQIPKCFITGFNTLPINMQLPEKQIFFGVVFNSTALKNIFHISAIEFANGCLDMTLADPTLHSLWHQLAEQKSFTGRTIVFSGWMKKRIPVINRQHEMFDLFLNNNSSQFLSVPQLSKSLCYSSRQLSRKLLELTGMNAEQILRYKKYLHSIHLMHHTRLSLTEIAYSCAFADQSHFIKTFKSFAQITPNEYRNNKSNTVGHIFENVR